MSRLIAGVVCVALAGVALAQGKKDDKAATDGTWTREASGLEVEFEFKKDVLKVTALQGDNGLVVTTKVVSTKDGVVKVKITNVEEKGTFPSKPPKDLEFSFKWTVKKDGDAELEDLKGEGLDDAKAALEGSFKKKKAKKN